MFGLFGQKQQPKSVCRVAYAMGDHDAGKKKLTIGGVYASAPGGAGTYSVEAIYKLDQDLVVYGLADLNKNEVSHVGVDGKLDIADQKLNFELAYNPAKDHGAAKFSTKVEDVKITAHISLPELTGSPLKSHGETVEAVVSLTSDDKVELKYDIQSRIAKGAYSRVLDEKNSVKVSYTFENQDSHSGAMKLTHKANDKNTFEIEADLGKKSYNAKWKQDTDDGQWIVKTVVPFDKHPKEGSISIKRRFDIDI